MQVFMMCLVYFLALAIWQPGHQTKDVKVMNGLMTDVEPMGHLGSQTLRRITSPQQIMRFPYVDIHILLVSRKSRTTPRYLADIERRKYPPPPKWFKVPREFSFFLMKTSSDLSGLTDNPTS
jgi:hypothetical protein